MEKPHTAPEAGPAGAHSAPVPPCSWPTGAAPLWTLQSHLQGPLASPAATGVAELRRTVAVERRGGPVQLAGSQARRSSACVRPASGSHTSS